jgi:regulatory protein
MASIAFREAKVKLESYCAYQDRCTAEVLKKMDAFDLSDKERKDLLEHLRSFKFLDDERFARSYASGKFVIKAWGRVKIKSHLRAKGLTSHLIDIGLQEIDKAAYFETIQSLATRKWRALEKEKDQWSRKQKVYRFLASRGFEQDLIFEVQFSD